ncbi:uncharacterized protein LOC131329231 [Rhododendron vialii]|uniref:uncharacterized protein LOC131329231 n=1 Tax=Rhododendron vialii TaxID=182163 RepID=UPI00265EE7C7|nr:uncharacterized protein LOC131329231 [Rhododendron vialii]
MAGYERLSFMDAYRGYHQIALAKEDQVKMTFISPRGAYCYNVVPFGLKNAGATFQQTITKKFLGMLGRILEAYIDDMVCKSKYARDYLRHLGEVFAVLKQHKLRLNAEKCAFDVGSGKFLGYMVSRRGIEADPTQLTVVQNIQALTTIKEVQQLTGMVAVLNYFIRRSDDLCRSFFQAIKTSQRRFVWTEECERALQSLKAYLSHAPFLVTPLPEEDLYLYLVVSDHATSSVLVRKEGMEHLPIFYSSKTMMDSQTRGQALADFFAELTPGLQDEANALATAAEKARIADEEAFVEWSDPLSESLRAQYTAGTKKPKREWKLFSGVVWQMTVDGASNVNGAGARIVLVSPSGTVHESVVSIGYPATNNEAEYEALIVGLQLALRHDADSFDRVEVEWIAREHNDHADALAGLASVYKTSGSHTIVFDEVETPSFEPSVYPVMTITLGPSKMDPIIAYLKNQVLPPNRREAHKIRCQVANYFLDLNDNLYRRTFTGPDLRVVHEDQVESVLDELHSRSYGAHSEGRTMAQQALTQGYWWLKMAFDIVGKMPKVPGGFEYMLTATDLFTKWVEASPLVKTTVGDVERNGQAEASNKTITWGLKRHLDRKLGLWVKKLPHVLWAYRTTPRQSTGCTPFSMAYGMEAVLPLSTLIPTTRMENFNHVDNNALVGAELNFAEELRDNANLWHAAYQQEVAWGYNKNV